MSATPATCRTVLEAMRDEFARRYPAAHCSCYASLHGTDFKFEVTHILAGHCSLGRGTTVEAAFADLERELGEIQHEPARKRALAQKLMDEAAALEASLVLRDLQQSKHLPVSSPVCQ